MTDLVIFRPGQTTADPVAWGAFEGGSMIEAGRVADVAGLSTIAGRFPGDARFAAVLPGEQIAMRALNAPPRQTAKALAAAAFLLEDELAEPVGDLHFVVSAGEPRVAYALSKTVIESWLAAFDAAGIALNEMVADFAAIGGAKQTVVFVEDGARVIASSGAQGFAADVDLARLLAPKILSAAAETASVLVYGGDETTALVGARIADRRALVHEADLVAIFGAAISAKTPPTNLLQGAYRRKAPQSFKLAAYRRPAMLAAGLAALIAVSGAAAGVRDARVAAAYQKSAEEMHKTAFPTFGDGDLRNHARQLLAGGAKPVSFLDMAARLSAGLEGNDGVAIDRIRYDGARGQFMFSIRSNSDAGIEAFRTGLDAQGLTATDNGGYRRSGDAWIGEMSARPK